MITAAEIAQELNVPIHKVQYVLTKARESGELEFRKVGQTFVYTNDALELVKNELEV